MKIPPPRFSERYIAQVEAERQYVLTVQEENLPLLSRRQASTSASSAGQATPALAASIEQAYRYACSENRRA